MKIFLGLAISSVLLWPLFSQTEITRELASTNFATLRSQELRCTIGNNAEKKPHRRGYNGVFRLASIHQSENLFVPQYAGLNLEHVFDASSRGTDQDVFFEPRRAPMKFEQIDERTVTLRQPTLPHWKIESTTTFRLVDPFYLDVSVECIPRADHFEGGAFGLFWASYINAPLDKSIYFLRTGDSGTRVWQQFCTQYHYHNSTVKSIGDTFSWKFAPKVRDSLFSSFSRIEYAESFFYGRFRNMVFIVIFDRSEGIRFSHSPSGGGSTADNDDTNPAWDFQWIVSDYEVGKTYRLNYRVVYKKWKDRADVLLEVAESRGRRE